MKTNIMILKSSIFAITITLACFTSCRKPGSTTGAARSSESIQETGLTYSTQTITLKPDSCTEPLENCTEATITFITAEGGSANLRDSLNHFIREQLISLQFKDTPQAGAVTHEEAAGIAIATFVKNYEEFKTEAEGLAPIYPWLLQAEQKVLYQSPKVSTLITQIYTFTGGAHGSFYSLLQSFDAKGRKINLPQMVTDTLQLKKMVLQEFRKLHEVPVGETLEEAGFFVDGNQLPLPHNAALTKEGLLLHYNIYEVAAYSEGPSEVVLPYAQLGQWLQPAFRP